MNTPPPWPWTIPLPWGLVAQWLLRVVLQVLLPGSDGQCRSAACGWPTRPRNGKPCRRTHRVGVLAPQSGKPWDRNLSLIPAKTCRRWGREQERGEDETKPEAERKSQVYWVYNIVCLGRSLSSLGSNYRPGQVWRMGAEGLVIFGRISWLEKMSQVCFASLHEHGYVSNTTPVFLPVLK